VTLHLAAEAGITVVSLPLVNQWTQDRDPRGGRTPRWRGVTLLHEAKRAGVSVAIASDNIRDQFYAYGDLDMLEVFTQVIRGSVCKEFWFNGVDGRDYLGLRPWQWVF